MMRLYKEKQGVPTTTSEVKPIEDSDNYDEDDEIEDNITTNLRALPTVKETDLADSYQEDDIASVKVEHFPPHAEAPVEESYEDDDDFEEDLKLSKKDTKKSASLA